MKAPGCKASLVKPSENKDHYNIRSYNKSQGIFSSWDCQLLGTTQGEAAEPLCSQEELKDS